MEDSILLSLWLTFIFLRLQVKQPSLDFLCPFLDLGTGVFSWMGAPDGLGIWLSIKRRVEEISDSCMSGNARILSESEPEMFTKSGFASVAEELGGR